VTVINQPLTWPLFPWLCLYSKDAYPPGNNAGLLYVPTKDRSSLTVQPVVYLVNIGHVRDKYPGGEPDFLMQCPREEFDTWGELEIKWRID
jgi:hypothetical protein